MKLSKYALIVAGLVSSASVMAETTTAAPAVGGNPTGTVNINGVIRTSTCSIGSPSTTDVGFNISKADISAVASGGFIAKDLTPVTIHVSSCKDTALGMTVKAASPDASAKTHGLFDKSQDPDNALYYLVGLKDSAVVSGGDTTTVSGYHIVQVDGNNPAGNAISIKDTSGSGDFDLNLQTMVARNGATSPDKLESALATTYTYTFTYA
ncbi:hypothetical protein ITK37_004295 [Salmonella enterica]|uniref:hypothetical protein n=1 Tax=Salmonella enterica TaxID=28901 RepID=UPI001077E68E|nr:hypothetical protein [Salmonella enterica subsp. enterica]EBS0892610.1 hypothetical protein [Salmonella enterica subsp. enterica serovar Abaetetuba]ECC6794911.1 hypothetical protein [Salmonella enterica]EDB3637340.1 hypothetical protein [Salmonella enterica subsp. enterica serovar Oranienburg]EEO9935928.1 hypothetical protein [Salmonella enterica subsp. enterica serovar Sandiego]